MFGPKKITYVFGGGGAYGFAHIGAIKYLESLSIYPSAICGTSIGSLIGGLYASGIKINEIEKIANDLDVFKMMELFLRPGIITGGLIDSYKIRDFLHGYIGDVCIEDLNIAFVSVACDSNTGQEVDIYSGSLIDAILASISVPTKFVPHYYNGRHLVDGGVCNNVAMDIAKYFSKYSIGINVIPTLLERNRDIEKEKKAFVKAIKKERKKLIPLNLTYIGDNRNNNIENDMEHKKLYNENNDDIVEDQYDDKQKEKYTLANSKINTLSIANQNQLNRIKTNKNNILINIDGLAHYNFTDFNKSSEIIQIGYEYLKSKHEIFTRFL